ncbi:hypothetical protein [Bradyrhizobium ivorense]|nr:hypothetical protein [Bradyrhizobium ivorense]
MDFSTGFGLPREASEPGRNDALDPPLQYGYAAARSRAEPIDERFAKLGTYEIAIS